MAEGVLSSALHMTSQHTSCCLMLAYLPVPTAQRSPLSLAFLPHL